MNEGYCYVSVFQAIMCMELVGTQKGDWTMFSSMRIFGGEPRHIRRARAYLQEARMAILEHSIAAEHYQASAQMYAERARRLEEEIASWEAMKNGTELVQALPEMTAPASVSGAGRIETSKPAAIGKSKSAVGIVRAA